MSLRVTLTVVMLLALGSVAAAVMLAGPAAVGPGPYPLSYKLKLAEGEHPSALMVLP